MNICLGLPPCLPRKLDIKTLVHDDTIKIYLYKHKNEGMSFVAKIQINYLMFFII